MREGGDANLVVDTGVSIPISNLLFLISRKYEFREANKVESIFKLDKAFVLRINRI